MHLRLSRPLLADSARPWAAALVASCAVIVVVLGLAFAHHTNADQLDQAIDNPVINLLASHQGLAPRLAAPGSPIPEGALSAVIVVACLLVGRLNGAVLAAVAVPAATALNDGLLKHLVHRTYLGILSYPSGHTATVFALAAAVAVLLLGPRTVRARPLRVLLVGAAFVLGGVVAVGVIGLRWHYFTDTVAGAAVGIGTVCGLALLLDLPAPRRQLDRARRYLPAPVARERRDQPKESV